jgi:hypothetical protein
MPEAPAATNPDEEHLQALLQRMDQALAGNGKSI